MYLSKPSTALSKHVRKSTWLEHAPFAFWLMAELRPKTVVDLGTYNGFSLLSFCQAAVENEVNTKIHGVDTWNSGADSEEVFAALKGEIKNKYSSVGVLLRSNCTDAQGSFDQGTIDLLHIDGQRCYKDVADDFTQWQDKLSDMGIVLFHNTQVQEEDFELYRFWSKLRKAHPSFEFVHGNGLGVAVVGKKVPAAIRSLMTVSDDERDLVRAIYARLGQINALSFELDETSRRAAELDVQNKAYFLEHETITADFKRIGEDLDQAVRTLAEQKFYARTADLKIKMLKNECDRLNKELISLRSSRSWRLMAPYRWFGHQMDRVQRAWRSIASLSRRYGGYVELTRRGLGILSKDGIRGVRIAWSNANVLANNSLDQVGRLALNDYAAWLSNYAEIDDAARRRIERKMSDFAEYPTISVVMPVYNAEPGWLAEAIESVRKQIYPHWELCIADDHSNLESVRTVLEKYANLDERIKVVYREENGHISAATNSAIELASGEWMALLDQDDLLSEDALFYVARAIQANPQVELIYSDEDKIADGKRFDPYFKSDWNPDLFRSHNMICHLGVYKIDRVRQIGGFRLGYEGSQDYDLALRFSDQLSASQIFHIPRVLYHWRSHSNSTAQSGGNKNYAAIAGQKALADHLERQGIKGQVEILPTGMYRTRYALPADMPLVSLIIPTRNAVGLIRQCVESILDKTDYPNYEILIVDNNSDDPKALDYFREIKAHERVFVIRDEQPFNYSAINNTAVARANGEFIGLVNNDIEVISPDWLSEMMSHALQSGVGAVGARLWYPDDRLQHGGVITGIGGVAGHAGKFLKKGAHGYFSRAELTQTLSVVTAACLIIRKSIYEDVGGLDEINLKVAFNDVDFCLKVREAGWRNVWTPFAELYHHESATRGEENTPEKRERFRLEVMHMLEKWNATLSSDPAYNPNLTLDYEDYSLAWPPRTTSDPTLAS